MTIININHKQLTYGMNELNRDLKRITKEGDRAVQSVLNRGLTSIRKEAVKESAVSLAVPQKVLRKRTSTRRASPKKLRIIITARTRAINAVVAGAKETDTGLSLGPYEWDGGFIVTSKYGKRVGVKRYGKKRYPLQPTEIGKSFVHREVKRGLENARARFERRYSRELAKEINKRYTRILRK